jgi:hypothetical protein
MGLFSLSKNLHFVDQALKLSYDATTLVAQRRGRRWTNEAEVTSEFQQVREFGGGA